MTARTPDMASLAQAFAALDESAQSTLAASLSDDARAALARTLGVTVAPAPSAPAKATCKGWTKLGAECKRTAKTADGFCSDGHRGTRKPSKAQVKAAQAEAAERKTRREQYAARKDFNRSKLAPAMREAGINPAGEPWAKAKAALAEGATLEQAVKAAQATV